eukprot:tig00020554_g10900.t1
MAVRGVSQVNYCSASSGECHGGFFGAAQDFGSGLVTAEQLHHIQDQYRYDSFPQVVRVLAQTDSDQQVVSEILCDVEVVAVPAAEAAAEAEACEAAPEPAEAEGASAVSGGVQAYKYVYTDPAYEPDTEYMASMLGEGEAPAAESAGPLQSAVDEEAAEAEEQGL